MRQVLLRGDGDLLVDSLVTAERAERALTEEARADGGGGGGAAGPCPGAGAGAAPRFGRQLVRYFAEGSSGVNLEADVNQDLTDPAASPGDSFQNQRQDQQAQQMLMMQRLMQRGPTSASVTARPVVVDAPLPVPSNLIPAGLAPAPQQRAAKKGKKKKKNSAVVENGIFPPPPRSMEGTNSVAIRPPPQQRAAKPQVLASQSIYINSETGAASPAPAKTARWAGPSFSNSPKPESVPLPTATLLQQPAARSTLEPGTPQHAMPPARQQHHPGPAVAQLLGFSAQPLIADGGVAVTGGARGCKQQSAASALLLSNLLGKNVASS